VFATLIHYLKSLFTVKCSNFNDSMLTSIMMYRIRKKLAKCNKNVTNLLQHNRSQLLEYVCSQMQAVWCGCAHQNATSYMVASHQMILHGMRP